MDLKERRGHGEHYGPHGCQHSIGGYIESGDGEICDVSGFDVGSEMAFKNAKIWPVVHPSPTDEARKEKPLRKSAALAFTPHAGRQSPNNPPKI